MNSFYPAFLFLTIFSWLSSEVIGVNDRDSLVSQRIYQVITNDFACFRRMNATHQIGCSSKNGGNVGVIHLADSQANIDWIVNKGSHAPYIALLYVESFTSEILGLLQSSSNRVNGVILLKRNDTSLPVSGYSPDLQCPNKGFGFYTRKTDTEESVCPKWNEPGEGILYQDWDFPIFYVSSDNSTKYLLDCYTTYNEPHSDGTPRDWPLCAAELDSFMFSAVDTPTCMRRNKLNEVSISPSRVCDPLGDANVWSTLIPSNQTKPHKNDSVIVIAARLDASSMFDQNSPGADTAATGITAVLALVKQLAPLKSLLQKSSNISNVYFILFNGESFDYIGSSRIVYDMKNDKFPFPAQNDTAASFPALLQMKHIKYYIELNQLALNTMLDSYYVHVNSNSSFYSTGYQTLMKTFGFHRFSIPLFEPTHGMGVPPSSLQSFLAEDSDFPGVVITNHDGQYRNKFYNSILDDVENIGYENVTSLTVTGIASLVATVAKAVEELIEGEKRPFASPIKLEPELVDDILQCYVKSPKCQLFQTVKNSSKLVFKDHDLPYPLYVAVKREINPQTILTNYVMSYYQGLEVNVTKDNCHRKDGVKIFEYIWVDERCYETTSSMTPAVSPAFDDIDNYPWMSGRYSTWTESIWSKLSVRIFLQPSKTHEIITLVSGILVFGASIVLFSWINNNADNLFKSRIAEGVC